MRNELNDEQIINLIKKEDAEHIFKLEKENDCYYKFDIAECYSEENEFVKNMRSSWDIPNDKYSVVVGIPVNDYFNENEDRISGNELNYIYGENNKFIINMPRQGGLDAYQIRDNKVTVRYLFKGQNSRKWREID